LVGAWLEGGVLLLLADFEPDLDQPDAAVDNVALHDRAVFEEEPVLLGRAEAHDVLDAGAVVPAAVEDHDLAAGREALEVALHVHLALLAVGGRRQRNNARDSRAHTLGNGLNSTA